MNWTIHCGDARSVLETLPAESVNCVCTSPPYWGLRDYGTARWDGGDPACEHTSVRREGFAERDSFAQSKQSTSGGSSRDRVGGDCRLCGAVRIDSQIGLESSPDAFVSALVEVFRGVRRVLRDDGVVWLNLGDSYSGSGKGGNPEEGKQATNRGSQSIGVLYGKTGETARQAAVTNVSRIWTAEMGMKPKQLIGVPWRVAFALQADGWYLRSDVIWSKPNPMPESVTDRPTKAHEYVFLLTKSERYAYDADAIRQPYARIWDETNGGSWAHKEDFPKESAQGNHSGAYPVPKKREVYTGQATKNYDLAGVQNPSDTKRRVLASMEEYAGANARTVWQIPTEPSPYEHFAVMPKALARKCILAGSQFGGVVLDPFAGVATTGVVALEEGRSFVGVELSPKYHAMARERLANVAPLLATEVPA